MASIVSGVIEKIQTGGSSSTSHAIASTAYGYCETAASEPIKNIDMTGFKLYEGVTVHIKFANANSADNPKLKFNGEADANAKPIVQYGTTAVGKTSETNGWYAGAVLTLTYDGISWVRDQDTWNALSTSQAGYVTQAPNDTAQFLRGDASWSVLPTASTNTAGIIQIGTDATNAAAGNHTHALNNLTKKALTTSTINSNNTTDIIYSSSSGKFFGHTSNVDWVGLQISSSVDRFQLICQLVADSNTLLFRQNDASSSISSNWKAWQQFVHTPFSNIGGAGTAGSKTSGEESVAQPVYVNTDGTATPIAYTIGADVPIGAVFTDHYDWSDITSKPDYTTRWPTWQEVTGKPDTFTPDAHDHNNVYLKLDGTNNMTANVNIIAGDTDKFVNFWYDTNKKAGASWRIGELGSGSGNTNYFVIQSGTSTTSDTTWTNAIRIGMNTHDINLNSTTDSSSIDTGSLTINGGMGIAKTLYIGTSIVRIAPSAGVSYVAGAQGSTAAIFARKKANTNAWNPAITLDTKGDSNGNGSWQIGNYDDETLKFVYTTPTNRKNSTNTNNIINLPTTAGTIALTSSNITGTAQNITGILALANLTKGDTNTALMGKGSSTAPAYVSVSPSISITAGTVDNAPKINTTVLGVSGTTAQELTKATTGVYGVTKLYDGVDSTSTTLAATANAVKTAYDTATGIVAAADALVFKGTLDNTNGNDTTTNRKTLPTTHEVGWTYKVARAGTYAGKTCEIGDLIICTTDGTAANDNHWVIIQNNIEGAVFKGTNSFSSGYLLVADGDTGKIKTIGSLSLWGQTFNGTTNIKGDMTDVGPNFKLPSNASTDFYFLKSDSKAAAGYFGKLALNTAYANADLTNYVLDVLGKVRIKLPNTATNSKEFIISGSNSNYISLHSAGIQAYNNAGNASLFYLQYYGGNLQIGSNDYSNSATRDFYGKFDFKSANGFTYSQIGSASDAVSRPIWFSYNGVLGRPVYDNNFKYTPGASIIANTAAYSILTLGNNANISTTTSHSEGKIILYSAQTAEHVIVGTATTTAYTHTLPNSTGTLLDSENYPQYLTSTYGIEIIRL